MGIRFACHECGKRMNIKSELAGRRGICPACQAKIRIPLADAATSSPVEESPQLDGNGASETQDGELPDGKISDARLHDAALAKVGSGTLLVDHEPEATWYVRPPNGGQYGPATSELLSQWIDEGRIAASSLLWRDGWPQWRAAAEAFPDLATRLPSGHTAAVAAPSKAPSTAPFESPAIPRNSTDLAIGGKATIGAQRRVRSTRRVLWIGVLSAVFLMLLGVLVVVANRG